MVAGKISAFLMLITTVVMISISNSSFRTLEAADYLKDISLFKIIGLIVYFFLPRINYISELASAVMLKQEIKMNIGLESLHLLVTTALFVFLADRVVKRRNF